MRIISTKVHGAVDYVMGIILMTSPWLFGFGRGGAETVIPVVLGAGVVLYSLVTDYELGAFRLIPMFWHLVFDFVGGVFLLVAPWLFGFSGTVWVPYVVFGILEIGASLMTQTTPGVRSGRAVAH